ncbi:MAG: GNAT family N-acetyltransferase [Candidatus Doudnabacteria bacterium RIFCSPLOWO2_01_FULL_48_57]|uniref:GNAT family N-acetyltransferase n=1 Tax=Candidatus Doudnabacteria bacterium RIFCSPLOWO2_02_FULL_48_13 TaxID=1817845 RepID=A0A1F5Q9K0_9BACT|nr:MAG: GNAT family N-acetyltransferase [Candidatus Doudnabacteria bacterium RIFCSPHIGHO2_01_48_18]OGE77053.1 MAG: GNAT family N-acetyltransferase [Candidatus Doudnabacteria bacterium RIFCSPHIGHO2_01_FULL_48_180]OGE90981.1 MAG: GNAT family N-acetyltransferase [Candidatus Doudnabacteria bacterium RIFCSPHIGHO2_12_FULL_47_25]OGE96343.1 MAG: GNAT family N-acetyltransferase [Candidatus Doudnabacteria bacterium RIFCSPLOWO2_01_FULL_48_57]OGE98582.1 MAG: GNAT family N-acetyltransferase [Candidatus Doud
MEIEKQQINANGIKIFATESGAAVGRAYLYLLKNDLHPEPFGFMEDVFVEENFRKHGIGSMLIKAIIEEAKALGCYKLICTSRYEKPDVHGFYKKFGFKEHGFEFRMDFYRV